MSECRADDVILDLETRRPKCLDVYATQDRYKSQMCLTVRLSMSCLPSHPLRKGDVATSISNWREAGRTVSNSPSVKSIGRFSFRAIRRINLSSHIEVSKLSSSRLPTASCSSLIEQLTSLQIRSSPLPFRNCIRVADLLRGV